MRGVFLGGVGLTAATAAAGLALAQATWTTVMKTDLQICAPVFGEVHRIELANVSTTIASICTEGGASFNADGCAAARDRLAKSQSRDPLDWFYDGNGARWARIIPATAPASSTRGARAARHGLDDYLRQ